MADSIMHPQSASEPARNSGILSGCSNIWGQVAPEWSSMALVGTIGQTQVTNPPVAQALRHYESLVTY